LVCSCDHVHFYSDDAVIKPAVNMHKIDYISQTSVILMAAKFFCEIYSAKIKCVRVATVLGQQNTWTFVRP